MAKTILITGANRGIGLEMARQAAAAGWQVTGTARDPATVQDFPGTLIAADVTDPGSLSLGEGPLDLLVCNAGQFRARGGIESPEHTAEAWASVLMTNVAGVFFTVRACLPRLRAAKGKVAVISSVMGGTGRAPGGSHLYRASKAAATNLAANLAQDLAPDGIAVGAYHPGWVRTDMGGTGADISTAESAAGLLSRFEALGMGTTGVIEDYAGRALAL
ncbi:MAG: SDR family NAD(P)-dependent oxidoreductase [Pseudomonadota bacterium]